MSSDKTPKSKHSIPSAQDKHPKILDDPSAFKNANISWQVSKIDYEGKWGLKSFVDKIEFKIPTGIENELAAAGNYNMDVQDALLELDGREFKSMAEFTSRLLILSKNNINDAQLRILEKYIREHIFWSEIFPKLKHFESETWSTIEREGYGKKGKTKHHSIAISRIIKDAQQRLYELKLDDIEQLFSLRLSGKIRIWGIRKFSFLQILWIDLEHEICPSIAD